MATQDWGASGGLPPELAMEHEKLRRKQAVAEAMIARGQTPLQSTTAGGYVVPISPLAGIAQLAQAYAGKRGMDSVDAGMTGIGQKYNEGLAQAVKDYTASGESRPIGNATQTQGFGFGDNEEGQETVTASAPPDPRARVAAAMASPYAPVRQLGVMDYQMADKHTERTEAREARAHEAQLARDARMDALREQIRAREQAGQQANDLRRELAQMGIDARRDMAGIAAGNRPLVAVMGPDGKPILVDQRQAAGMRPAPKAGGGTLPTPALKLQQEELEAIGIASTINADLGAVAKQIEDGTLNPSLVGNALGSTRNALGLSTQESRNLASFKATLEKLRNDSLRLNKGVQTEGDAQRAWNEMMANINDKGVVQQRLTEIRKINERAVNLRRMNIDAIRSNYGVEPLDTAGFQNQPAAVGAGGQPFVAPGTPMPGGGAGNDPLGLRR